MDIVYSFEYLEEVVKNDISQILQNIRNIIKRAIEERLGVDPFSFGKPLRYSWKGHKSLKVSLSSKQNDRQELKPQRHQIPRSETVISR